MFGYVLLGIVPGVICSFLFGVAGGLVIGVLGCIINTVLIIKAFFRKKSGRRTSDMAQDLLNKSRK